MTHQLRCALARRLNVPVCRLNEWLALGCPEDYAGAVAWLAEFPEAEEGHLEPEHLAEIEAHSARLADEQSGWAARFRAELALAVVLAGLGGA